MARYNPDLMQIDSGGSTAPVVDTRIALRKLQSGQPLTDDEKRSLGLPITTAPTDSTGPTGETGPTGTPSTSAAATSSTGIAGRGSKDILPDGGALGEAAVDADTTDTTDTTDITDTTDTTNKSGNLPAGFTAGSFPKELEQFFGSGAGIIGYRIITNPDGSQQLEVADAPGSTKTFGFKFGRDSDGRYVKFRSPDGGAGIIGGADDTAGAILKTEAQLAAEAKAAEGKAARQSAYDLLYEEFDRYGLGSLVTPLKDLITSGVSPSEFTLRLRETDAYKKRFSANQARIKNGLRALSEFEYITKEDAYQEVMRRRGLPPEYYAKGDLGVQKGFDALLAGDVSSAELEDRIVTAQDRVLNANPEIAATLKQFYPGISNGDILAYALDPANAINAIKRKITAAEIGVAAKAEGLTSGLSRAEELATMGITGEAAKQGYQTIAGVVPRASQLSEIYKQDPYTQTTAETEVFGLAGSTEAARQRKKLTSLETAAFSGSAGAGAIARDRAGVI